MRKPQVVNPRSMFVRRHGERNGLGSFGVRWQSEATTPLCIHPPKPCLNSHANTIAQVGGRPYWWGATRSFSELVGAVPWEIAREQGGYVMDAYGQLKPEVREIIKLCTEYDALLSFGHLSKPEQVLVADEVVRQNFKKAMFDGACLKHAPI